MPTKSELLKVKQVITILKTRGSPLKGGVNFIIFL